MTLTCHERRRPLAFEAALRLEIDRARGRVGVLVGAGGVVDLAAVEAVDGDLVEAERACGAAERLRAAGARGRHAVGAHADVLRVEAAEARAAGVGADVVAAAAGNVFQKFADAARGDVTKNVGREAVGEIHRAALLHEGLGVALAFGADDAGVEFMGWVRPASRAGLARRAPLYGRRSRTPFFRAMRRFTSASVSARSKTARSSR